MKKTKSLILLGASLLLTSCSSYDEEALINESKRDIASLQETTKTKYAISCAGHVLEYKEFYQADREFDVPTGEVINSTALVGGSYLLQAPVRIKEESYIREDAATNATSPAPAAGTGALASEIIWPCCRPRCAQIR